MSKAEKIGSIKAFATAKTLTANGMNPVFEVSAISGQGTLAGADIVQMMATYTAEMGPDGILHGECPNSGVVVAADGVATYRATGVGTFTENGGSTFKGVCYFQTVAPSLSKLNGAAVIFNWDVDAEGNAAWELWQWK
ncbi:hypothetical protein M1O29_02425 [Dehalococcoidia bacterium]|nr:hypothetical protein [Dehalococcoidia bacterium]